MAQPADDAADDRKKKKEHHPRDAIREAVETIVFVVVLVLLLKLFVTEAFVIPTGSMAETLYGYQKLIECPKCGHEFPVNSHDEVEPNNQTGKYHRLVEYCCPNCRYPGRVDELKPAPTNRTGDRVLVLKPIYHLARPNRGDVVVFKYPKAPQERWVAANYIKRAMGFGRETVGIHRGDLYVTDALEYPADEADEYGRPIYPRPDDEKKLWEVEYTYFHNNPRAVERFNASRKANFSGQVPGGFGIVRKTEEQVLADMRVVWDNDRQPKGLAGKVPPRWYAPPEHQARWTGDDAQQPRTFRHSAGELDWIRYRHLAWAEKANDQGRTGLVSWYWGRSQPPVPGPVDNFLGYNAGVYEGLNEGLRRDDRNEPLRDESNRDEHRWVGDLLVECEAQIGDGAEVVLELSKGVNRFRATFGGGKVTLSRTGPNAGDIASRPCKVGEAGKYKLRFANVDCRLWVWVNDRRVDFGTDADYAPGSTVPAGDRNDPAGGEGWTLENDVAAPASIGAKGEVIVRSIKLHRDIYYTRRSGGDHAGVDLYYVHPGHYLCLGDNSAQSSDSRTWGLVPERLMLGKAVFVFFPVGRVGFIK